MPPITVIATLKTINGKPNDPGANPIADIALRTEMTPEMIHLFGGIGSEYDVTFTRRGGEQLDMFEQAAANAEIHDEATDLPWEADDAAEEPANGVAEPEPVAGGRRRR